MSQTGDIEHSTVQERFVARLVRREPLLGTLLTLPAPELAEVVAAAGFDWLFVDMEHGLLDFAAVQRVVQAAGHLCPCIVRVPNNEPILIAKALDTGAAGIIGPHVNTADEARAIVRAARYPPAGARSLGVARAQGYGRRIADAIARDNDRTIVVAQVEHIDAVAHIDEIVAVPGVSAVFIGPFDLSASLGKPGEIGAPDVEQAIGTIAAACAARPLPCGIFVVSGDAARRAFAAGQSLVCAMTDTLLFADAVERLLAAASPEGTGTRG
jgi:2-dehydro-3-deoxyglucarate aldolase/4-hydroxy-2-oxoheptanedioate aldolase